MGIVLGSYTTRNSRNVVLPPLVEQSRKNASTSHCSPAALQEETNIFFSLSNIMGCEQQWQSLYTSSSIVFYNQCLMILQNFHMLPIALFSLPINSEVVNDLRKAMLFLEGIRKYYPSLITNDSSFKLGG
jgi:hypothetical protein